MKTKARINSVLKKKLEELESLFEEITSTDNYDPYLSRELELGVLFATTLLTAEISSRPMDVEGEEDVEEMFKLRCMATRLSEMKAFLTNKLPGHDINGPLIEPEIGSLESYAGIFNGETDSAYSLDESGLNESSKADEELVESGLNESSKADEEEEEEKEEEVDAEAEQWPLFQDASSEENREITFPAVVMVKDEVVDEEVKEKGRVFSRAVVCFGLIGFVGGMMSLVAYIGDSMNEDIYFLTPT